MGVFAQDSPDNIVGWPKGRWFMFGESVYIVNWRAIELDLRRNYLISYKLVRAFRFPAPADPFLSPLYAGMSVPRIYINDAEPRPLSLRGIFMRERTFLLISKIVCVPGTRLEQVPEPSLVVHQTASTTSLFSLAPSDQPGPCPSQTPRQPSSRLSLPCPGLSSVCRRNR